jgi:Tfp pilus assembly protein PilE
MRQIRHQLGITVLEILLVFAIAGTFAALGINQYRQYRMQQDVALVQRNVNTLFAALANYYQANCKDQYDSAGAPITNSGALSPTSIAYPPASTAYQAVNVSALVSAGYLTQWQPVNPLVNPTSNYIVQFNPMTSSRYVSTNFSYQTPPLSSPKIIAKADTVVIWRAQVAVRISDTANIQTYKGLMAADCISSLKNNIVTPCNANPTAGDYLVWERLPSFASPRTSSGLWLSMARVRQFNESYQNDTFYALNIDDSAWNTSTHYEIYLCGG